MMRGGYIHVFFPFFFFFFLAFLIPGSEEIKITTGCSQREHRRQQGTATGGLAEYIRLQDKPEKRERVKSGIPCGQIMWPSSLF